MEQGIKVAECLKKEFNPYTPLAVHWDDKLIEDRIEHKQVDRLSILVSAYHTSHQNSSNKIKCFCLNTTVVNTGLTAGAYVLCKEKIERNANWLAYCQHVGNI